MMQIATTPHHTFKLLNAEANTISKFSVTYVQEAGQSPSWEELPKVSLTKTSTIASPESWFTVTQPTTTNPYYLFEVDLTVTESKKFRMGPIEIQFTVISTGGKQIKSPIYVSKVDKALDDSDLSS